MLDLYLGASYVSILRFLLYEEYQPVQSKHIYGMALPACLICLVNLKSMDTTHRSGLSALVSVTSRKVRKAELRLQIRPPYDPNVS